MSQRLKALIPACDIKVDYPLPHGLYALGGRFSLVGVIRFPADATVPATLNVRSHLVDPVSGEKYAELNGKIRRYSDAGAHFEIELPLKPPIASLLTSTLIIAAWIPQWSLL